MIPCLSLFFAIMEYAVILVPFIYFLIPLAFTHLFITGKYLEFIVYNTESWKNFESSFQLSLIRQSITSSSCKEREVCSMYLLVSVCLFGGNSKIFGKVLKISWIFAKIFPIPLHAYHAMENQSAIFQLSQENICSS